MILARWLAGAGAMLLLGSCSGGDKGDGDKSSQGDPKMIACTNNHPWVYTRMADAMQDGAVLRACTPVSSGDPGADPDNAKDEAPVTFCVQHNPDGRAQIRFLAAEGTVFLCDEQYGCQVELRIDDNRPFTDVAFSTDPSNTELKSINVGNIIEELVGSKRIVVRARTADRTATSSLVTSNLNFSKLGLASSAGAGRRVDGLLGITDCDNPDRPDVGAPLDKASLAQGDPSLSGATPPAAAFTPAPAVAPSIAPSDAASAASEAAPPNM